MVSFNNIFLALTVLSSATISVAQVERADAVREFARRGTQFADSWLQLRDILYEERALEERALEERALEERAKSCVVKAMPGKTCDKKKCTSSKCRWLEATPKTKLPGMCQFKQPYNSMSGDCKGCACMEF